MDSLLRIGLSNALVATGLALLAALAGLVWRRPALLHSLWLLVLLKLITPPLVQVPVPGLANAAAVDPAPVQPPEPSAVSEHVEGVLVVPAEDPLVNDVAEAAPLMQEAVPIARAESAAETGVAAAPGRSTLPWENLAAAAWVLGSLVWLVFLAIRLMRFRRLLRFARPASPALGHQVQELAGRLELKRVPEVLLVPGPVSPMLWALGRRPRLLWPADLLGRLDTDQRATLLTHELAHLRRRDHWVRALELLVTGLYWWDPVVWWACRRLRAAEEECCDAWVVWALPQAARAYALALVETLDFLSESRPALPPVASGVGPMPDLKRRLTMIMQKTTARRLGWGGFLTALALGGVLLPWLPSWAQEPRSEPSAPRKALEEAEKQRRAAQEQLERAIDQLRAAHAIQGTQVKEESRDAKDPAKAAEIDKTRAEIKDLQAMMEEIQKKAREVEERMRKAHDRLAQLEGRPGAGARVMIIIREPDGKVREIPLPPGGADILKRFEVAVPPGGPGRVAVPVPPVPPVPGRPAGPPGGDRRLEELEKKLDALMKEVEGLRKESKKP